MRATNKEKVPAWMQAAAERLNEQEEKAAGTGKRRSTSKTVIPIESSQATAQIKSEERSLPLHGTTKDLGVANIQSFVTESTQTEVLKRNEKIDRLETFTRSLLNSKELSTVRGEGEVGLTSIIDDSWKETHSESILEDAIAKSLQRMRHSCTRAASTVRDGEGHGDVASNDDKDEHQSEEQISLERLRADFTADLQALQRKVQNARGDYAREHSNFIAALRSGT